MTQPSGTMSPSALDEAPFIEDCRVREGQPRPLALALADRQAHIESVQAIELLEDVRTHRGSEHPDAIMCLIS